MMVSRDKMNVIWLSVREGTPSRGYWDQRLLEEFFINENHIETSVIKPQQEAIVVIPGAYQNEHIYEINMELAKLGKCTVIMTGDEENKFPIDQLSHPNMRVFAEYYNPKYKSDITWLPIGPANTFELSFPPKLHNFGFAGQVNHARRQAFIDEIRYRTDGVMFLTEGFAQGMPPEEYYEFLSHCKVVPSPAGNVCPDAFRTYEAICAGAVPIATGTEWHKRVFGTVPFPVIDEFSKVSQVIDDALAQYPKLNNRVQSWWLQEKRKLKNNILGSSGDITVMIPVSPIKSHPYTAIIDETISTVRHHLPDAEIIVTFDGVRKEQEDRRTDYERFKREFLWNCLNNKAYRNILPLDFEEHSHQVQMARVALKYVNTDLVLYCEQDTPLTPDEPIEWQKCIDFIRSGRANMIRFHFEAHIPEPHQHMMIGPVEDGFLKTSQWSQRPHLISRDYFERILEENFSEDANCFIEDKMHGVVSEAYIVEDVKGWEKHRVWIYHPDGGNIKRSYHIDGRAGEPKWDESQIW
jgi:hypothetical protein